MALNTTFEARTDVGRERSENQDHFGSAIFDDAEFYIVCDGMGGHAGGSTASRLGVQAIEAILHEHEGSVPERVEAAILHANDAIHTMAKERRELRGMGTTVVILGIDRVDNRAHVAHVGDSRIYRLRDHVFQRMTRDHTMVQRLVDEGIITEEEAEHHPNSNVISRSLGGHPFVEVEHGPESYELQDGDMFLLCTDGLSGLVSEGDIAEVLAHYAPAQAAEHLIDMANEAGGHDNTTVEIVLIGEQKPPFVVDVELVHPPRGPSAQEMREREAAALQDDEDDFIEEPSPVELPRRSEPSHKDEPASTGAPVIEDQSNTRLLRILGGLVVVLIILVAGLLMRMDRVQVEDAVVPVDPSSVELDEDEEPLPFEHLEELEPQPVYEVLVEEEEHEEDAVARPSGE